MENNNLLKIFRQKFLRNAKHAISASGSSVDQQNALAPIRRVGSCKEGVRTDSGVGVNLLQNFVDVDRVRLLPLLLFFLAINTGGATGLFSRTFLCFLSCCWRHIEI